MAGRDQRLREEQSSGHVRRAARDNGAQAGHRLRGLAEADLHPGEGDERAAHLDGRGGGADERGARRGEVARRELEGPLQEPPLHQSGTIPALGELRLAGPQRSLGIGQGAAQGLGRAGRGLSGGRPQRDGEGEERRGEGEDPVSDHRRVGWAPRMLAARPEATGAPRFRRPRVPRVPEPVADEAVPPLDSPRKTVLSI